MYFYQTSQNRVRKTASALLAVILLISPLGNIAFAGATEDTAWVYDVARVAGQTSVIGQYGDYRESYAIDVPPGTNGLTPILQLSYSSQADGYGSSVGYGWSLFSPAVVRLNKNGVDQIYSRSDFQSSYDGELTEADANEFIPRVQTSSFKTYTLGGTDWVTYSQDGTKYTFGSTTNARQRAYSTSTDIYAWYLDEIQDANGNKIKYEYIQSEGKVYPSKIFYGYDSLGDNAYEVDFVYASSTSYISYEPGFAVVNDRILESIVVYFDGDLITQYDLEYENPNGSTINLLNSIHKIGYSENGIAASTSPRYFEYVQESAGWTNDTSIATTAPSYLYLQVDDTGQSYTQYSRDMLVDMNGDGLVDWVEENTVYLNTGGGWEATSSWPSLPVSNIHLENRLVDVNGDLLPDIVTFKKESWDPSWEEDDVYTKSVRLNQGDGTWVVDSALADTLPGDLYWYHHGYPSGHSEYIRDVFFVDMNGDGLNDWIYDGYVYLNTGAGWATTSSWARLQSGSESFDAKWRLSDVNGDGLPDLIKSDTVMYDSQLSGTDTYTNEVWLSFGNGEWERNSDWENTIPSDFNSRFYIQYWNYPSGITNYQNKVYLADVNGDDLNDWLYYNVALLNTGTGWATTTVSLPMTTDNLTKSYRLADVDGDKQLDFVRYLYKHFFGTVTHTKEARINNSQKQWLLSTTTNEYGGVTSVAYDVTTKKIGGNLPNPDSPIVKYVVSNVTKDPLIGEKSTVNYKYEDAEFYFASSSVFDRKFAGFGLVTTETSIGKNKIYYHQGNGNDSGSYESGDDYAKIGMPYRVEKFDLSDDLYRVVMTDYGLYSLATSSDFVKRVGEVSLDYDGDGDHRDRATAYTYDNSTGLVTSQTEYGEVSSGLSGSYSDTGSDKRTTEFEYASSEAYNILGLLSKETLKNNSGTKVKESKYYYDGLSSGSVSSGNLTKQEDWIEGSAYIGTEWSHNSLGQIISETDPRNNVTLLGYDSYDLFVSSSTNAEGHNTQYKYDYSSGEVATTTDANGEVFVTIYDGLDRPVQSIIPDPQTGNPVTQKTYSYTDTAGVVSLLETGYLNSSTSTKKYSYFDGFGRLLQERSEAEDTNQYSVKDYVYGDHGLLHKESLPYFSGWHSRTNATNDSDLLTVYSYDALSRVSSIQTTVGTTYKDYDQWLETVTDTAGNDKTYEYDAYGRLVQVTEEGVNSYDTAYDWNARGDLVKITDADSNVRNLTYDGLSRRTSLEDLHDTADGVYGTWLFAYDATGNVSSTTDPKGQVVNYTYDDIGRVLTEDYLGTGYTDVVYAYDSCTNGVTRLCSVSNDSATTTYTYTPNGLTASETKTVLGTAYNSEYEYDWLGNRILITYPDNSEVKYTYNKANEVEKVEQRESGGTFAAVVKDFDYGPHGMVTYQKNGNDSETTKSYDEEELYRLRSIMTTATSTYGTGGAGDEMLEIMLMLDAAEELTGASSTEPVEDSVDDIDIPESSASSTESYEEDIDSVIQLDPEVSSLDTSTSNDIDLNSMEVHTSTDEASPTEMVSEDTTTESVIKTFDESMSIEEVSISPVETMVDSPEIPLAAKNEKVQFLDVKNKGLATAEMMKNKPEVKFELWDGEDTFSVSYYKVKGAGRYDVAKRLMEWGSGNEKVHAYPLDVDGDMENGGFEIEVVLEQKPESNVFDFEVSGAEEFDFFYQSPLNEDEYLLAEEELDYCIATECVNLDGDVFATRAENIIGSYAVYHKEKQGTYDHMDYKTGKAFHIFRPKAIDAEGNEVWAEMNYENGTLSVTVPEEFLLSAQYPVRVDPTFGKTSVGGSSYRILSNSQRINAIKASPSNSGVISSISFYLRQYSGGSWTPVGIYADGNGVPTNLLKQSPYVFVNTTAQWRTGSISQEVVGGNDYWIAFLKGADVIYYDSVTNGRLYAYNPDNAYFKSYLGGGSLDNKKISIYANYTANEVPTAPTSLQVNGESNPVGINNNVPDFSALYNDPNSSDTATHYQIQVSTSSSFTSSLWDSGSTTLTTEIDVGERSEDIAYAGTALASSTAYYWRIKFWDNFGDEGIWSTSTATFSLATGTAATVPFTFEPGGVQNLLYTYDSVGNITQIVDSSETVLAATTTYIYDDLYRLTSASTTAASSTPYTRSYSYNAIGNITNKSDVGSYAYAETNYANPHAATAIGGVSQTYDNNGNLTATGDGDAYTWNYRNQLIQSTVGGDGTNYGYDSTGSRVYKGTASATTTYPSSLYEITGTSTKKHIYANGALVATVESDTPAPKTYYVYTNHLGSTNAVLDQDGYITQELAYYPFGDSRIDNQYGPNKASRTYIGEIHDDETDLSYLNARYYDNARGQFMSQDPVFMEIGQTKDGKLALLNPQAQNSYSYGLNNPITQKDPTGRCPWCVVVAGVAMYAPQITSYLSALATPLGQFTIGQAIDDVQNGDYGWALFGMLTAGEGSAARTAVNATERVGSNVAFTSFSSFKRAAGPAGEGRQWHHIVEQNPTNVSQFGQEVLQNSDNLVSIPTDTHRRISGFYSSKQSFTGDQTVRQWVSQQPLEQQQSFGKEILEKALKDDL